MDKKRWQIRWFDLEDCESGNAFLFDGTLEEVTEKCERMKTDDTDYYFEFYSDLDYSEERQKDEPNGELIDFCKRRINYINRLEKKGVVRKKQEFIGKPKHSNEYLAVCTETDRVLVVEFGGKIVKQFEWHMLDEKRCNYIIKENGKIKTSKEFELSDYGLKQWKEEYKRHNGIV